MVTSPQDCPGCSGEGFHESHRRGPGGDDMVTVLACQQCSGAGVVECCVVCELPLPRSFLDADLFDWCYCGPVDEPVHKGSPP